MIEYLLEPREVDADALEQGDSDASVYRLVSTLLDPDAAPAHELATLYRERWEIETALDELKTHQRGPQVVLRSEDTRGRAARGVRAAPHALRHPPVDA